MISAQLWKNRYNGDPQVIGKTATLNSIPNTIIGVLPADFEFPATDVDVWVTRPAEFSAIQPQYWSITPILIGFGRLKPRVNLEQARAETDVLARQFAAFYTELVQRAAAVPGVRGATVALTIPMRGGAKWAAPIQVVGQPAVQVNRRPLVALQSVTPGYFQTMKISIRRGREFIARDDTTNAPPVAMINESLARHSWPSYPNGQDPIEQHFRLGGNQSSPGFEIIGIAADVRERGLATDAEPEVYLPTHLYAPQRAALIVRTEGDPEKFANAILSQVLSIDRDQPVSAVKTMDQALESTVGQQRLTLLLLAVFAAVAVLLAIIGLYGVISYSVAQRTREVGIRRALGAQQSDILRLIVGQGLTLTLAGGVVGIVGAFALTRVMKGLLFSVTATDPATFAAVAALFVLVAAAASYFPARRATRLDPMTALR